MIFFFAISFYQTDVQLSGLFYFYQMDNLAFGFVKSGKYSITISDSKCKMVFGLATKQEIKYIDQFSIFKYYCNGSYQLSKIQYNISSRSINNIDGIVDYRGVYIPYLFMCSMQNDFNLELDFINNDNHRDYRFNITEPYFTLISVSLYEIVALTYIIFTFIYHQEQKKYEYFLIVSFYTCGIIQLLFYFLFIEKSKQMEFIFYTHMRQIYFIVFNLIIFFMYLIIVYFVPAYPIRSYPYICLTFFLFGIIAISIIPFERYFFLIIIVCPFAFSGLAMTFTRTCRKNYEINSFKIFQVFFPFFFLSFILSLLVVHNDFSNFVTLFIILNLIYFIFLFVSNVSILIEIIVCHFKRINSRDQNCNHESCNNFDGYRVVF